MQNQSLIRKALSSEIYRVLQNPCNTVLDLRGPYMEGSELCNFNIRSSEV